MRVGDLFCGCGGFSEGFRQAGFEVAWGIDNWQPALASFHANNPKADYILKDVRDVRGADLVPVDVVIGSPPCVEFSRLQNGRGNKNTGLIAEAYRLIKELAPKYWILENVPQAYDYLTGNRAIIRAERMGVPQIRERVFASNIQFPLFPTRRVGWGQFFPGKMMTTIANTGSNGKRWKLPNEPCWTISTSGGIRIDGRPLAIADYKVLSGLPGDYILCGSKTAQMRQIGNAVCPPVAFALASAIAPKEMPRLIPQRQSQKVSKWKYI